MIRILVLIGIAFWTIALEGLAAPHPASGASPTDQQILSAVSSLQNSINNLTSGAITDLQSQITALQNGLNTLQTRVTTLQSLLVGPGLSSVRITPEIAVGPDENAGCTVINVSSVTLDVRTDMLSFDGALLNEPGVTATSTDSILPGHAEVPIGLNQPGGSFQRRIHCRFTVLTSGRSRSDIRGQVENVQREIVLPAE